MSNLQMLLIVIGVLIILAVVVLNWWQERRFHKQVESSFSSLQHDALLDDPSAKAELTDEPQFDSINLHEAMHEPNEDFAFNKPLSDTEFSFDVNAIDAKSIEDDFSRTTTGSTKDTTNYRAETQINSDPDANLNIKPAQHNDIKAIFEGAFGHVNKVATHENINTLPDTPKVIATVDEAQKNMGDDLHLPDSRLTEQLQDTDPIEPQDLPASVHTQIDLTAVLFLAAETPLNLLADSLINLLTGYDKPVFVHVLTANKEWYLLKDAVTNQQVAPDQLISRVTCSLQLADRTGAASRNTLNRFQLEVETAGLDINAHVEWQNTGDALATAIALDAFCIEVDKTIGFHLQHGESGAFTGTKLRGIAEAQGLTLTPNGTFKHFENTENTQSSSKQASFVMFNRDDHPFSPEMLRASVVKAITFQFDIPHVKQCGEVFTQMVQVARQMEASLNAVLVDDNNRVLGDIQIEKIRQQLKVIHATMLVRGIIPGSDSALRLFS